MYYEEITLENCLNYFDNFESVLGSDYEEKDCVLFVKAAQKLGYWLIADQDKIVVLKNQDEPMEYEEAEQAWNEILQNIQPYFPIFH